MILEDKSLVSFNNSRKYSLLVNLTRNCLLFIASVYIFVYIVIALYRILGYAFKGYKNRFTNDPYLSKDRMFSLYKGWLENLIKRDGGYLIVAERKGRVVGFLGYFCLKELCEVTGRLHVGRALTASGPGG